MPVFAMKMAIIECLPFNCTDGWFWGLAWDWIAGRIYLVTGGGFVIACDGRLVRKPKCAAVLSDQGALYGIAVDPTKGYLTFYFWLSGGGCRD